jgi:hypothetical protein
MLKEGSSSSRFERFVAKHLPALPPLAWCAQLRAGDPEIVVLHGSLVHVDERFVVEGAWAGSFEARALAECWAVAGSGAQLTRKGVVFVTPTHMLERLHWMRRENAAYVSNSFAFLLAITADDVSETYRDYQWDFRTSMRGLGRYRNHVPTALGGHVRLFYHCNFLVHSDLSFEEHAKPLPPPFEDYERYLEVLNSILAAFQSNASATARLHGFSFLATVSAGYDSPACAALLRSQGCNQAVTFVKARSGYKLEDDSGTPVGVLLGYQVEEFRRESYMAMSDFPEAEFLATGMGGEEVVFAPLATVLKGRVLVTGYFGDTVWGLNPASVNQHLRMIYAGGTTFGEFRLRAAFIHIPLPCFGYIRHPEVFAISQSAEMAPWRLGNDYDRPIPRRIVETSGVPRNLFGQAKMAVSQPLWNSTRLHEVMTPASVADLEAYVNRTGLFNSRWDKASFSLGRAAYRLNERVEWRLESRSRRMGRVHASRMVVPERFSRDRDLASMSFHWGFRIVRARYATALAET